MKVLKWKQSRTKLVSRLSTLDSGIAKRADDLESAWGKQRDGGYVEPDAAIGEQKKAPQEPPVDGPDAIDLPPVPDAIPDYLR